eukprot:564509_1
MSTETEKEEFKRDDTFTTLLRNADIKQSFFKAMFQHPDRPATQQSKDVATVMKFVVKNVTKTEDLELSKLISANIKYIALNLNQYTSRLYNNAENIEYSYHIDQRRAIEAQWIKCGMGLHKMAHMVLKQCMDIPNSPNIFYALYILKGLCLGQNEQQTEKIISQTDLIPTIFTILNSDGDSNNTNTTWMEQFMCVQILRLLPDADNKSIWIEWNEKYNLNIIKLLIKISVNCFVKLPYYYRTMKDYQRQLVLLAQNIDLENKSKMESQDDIPTYLRSGYTEQNVLTRSLHFWCYRCRIASLDTLRALSHRLWTNESLMSGLNAQYLKRLLQISTMTMRQGKQTFPPQVNSIDVLVLLSQSYHIAKTLVSDKEIMKILIICIRSRGSVCEFNNAHLLVLIYFLTVQHELMPRCYFNDVIYALMDTIESEWKNLNLLHIFDLPSTNELTIRTLKYLFGVPRFSIVSKEQYLCVICQYVFNNPHTLPCGHSLCYFCLTCLLGTRHNTYETYFVKRFKPNLCPMCRKEFKGKFERDDEKSSFTKNYKLQNEMNASLIRIENDDNDDAPKCDLYNDFKGTECEFWTYLKTQHVNALYDDAMAQNDKVRAEFVTFCRFMEKNSYVYKADIETERKEQIAQSLEIKTQGNALFKNHEYKAAILKYKEALNVCPLFVHGRVPYLSNMTLCYMKLNDYVNAYRSAQQALMISSLSVKSPKKANTHIKLLNNCAVALSKLLFKDDERHKLNTLIHDKLCACHCNAVCLTRRVYDILLYQLLWECEFMYCLRKISRGNDNQQYADNLRKTDDFICNLKEIDKQIEHIGPLNFEEYQYLTYVDTKNEFKANMHSFIVDSLCKQRRSMMRNEITDMIDDLLDVFDEGNSTNMKGLSVQTLVEKIDLNWKKHPCYVFYSKYIDASVVQWIVGKSKLLELVGNNEGMYCVELQRKSVLRALAIEQEKEETEEDNKSILVNEWSDNNDDFITALLYKWERVGH